LGYGSSPFTVGAVGRREKREAIGEEPLVGIEKDYILI
jgi:hypothetical protein